MPKNVLYPTDFSENSKKAVDYINELNPENVVVLHVIDEEPLDIYEELPSWTDYDVETIRERLIDSARIRAKEIADKIKNSRVEVVVGEPWFEIVRRSENYDLVVLGAFGRGGILERLLGSTAEAVLRHSRCPVLVVK